MTRQLIVIFISFLGKGDVSNEKDKFTKGEEGYIKWRDITYGVINIWIFRKGFSTWVRCSPTS